MKKFIDRICNISEKNLYKIVLLIFVLSIIPIWFLGKYAVPSLDDYYFGIMPHQAWLKDHTLASVVGGAMDMVRFYYQEKQATYTSIFIMALCPSVISERLYFVTPIILSGMIIGSVSVLIHVIITDCLGVKNKYLTGITNLLICFLIIQTLLVPLEAIFWYNGGIHYVFMQSVLYFEIAAILHFLHTDNKKSQIEMIIIASFLGFLVGGGNLISGLQACILGVLFVCFYIWKMRGQRNKLLALIPIIITIIAYGFNALAPCNSLRAEVEVQMNPVKAIIESLLWGAIYTFSWSSTISVIVFIVVTVIVWKLAKDTKKKFINPVFFAIICYCVFSAMLTPTWYAMSSDAPSRVKNIIFIARYLFIFVNIVNDCGYIRSRGKEEGLLARVLNQTEGGSQMVIVAGGILICLVFLLAADKNTYTSMSAVRSILTGEASRYYSQSCERFEVYNDPSVSDVVVKPLTDDAKPYLLFKEDINDEEGEEGYWQSVEIADYYGKNSISVAK